MNAEVRKRPHKIHMLNPTAKVMVLTGGVLGRCLSHEGGTLMKRLISYKRDPRELPCPSHHARTQKVPSVNQEAGPWRPPHPTPWCLDLSSLQYCEK